MANYDKVSPGHVLSMHEEAAAAVLLARPGYCQRDLDIWGDDSLLGRALHSLNCHITDKVGHDLRTAIPDFYEGNFNEPGRYRPGSLLPFLGRRRIGDFSFVGGIAHMKDNHSVFFLLYLEDGEPRAYVPINGNAVAPDGSPVETIGDEEYLYNHAEIDLDIREHFGIL